MFIADMPYDQFASKIGLSSEREQPKKKETTVGGVASEVAKGAVRGPSDIGMLMGKFGARSAFGPVLGPVISKTVVEGLSRPSREMVRATPATDAERFAGTASELLSGGAASGGMSSIPASLMTALSALGGATGEQLGGDTGKMVGSLVPGLSIPITSLLGSVYRGGRNLVDPFLPGGSERAAARGMGEAMGSRRGAVEAELARNQQIVPGSPVTAAEAAERAGSTELSALQRIAAAKADPSGYRDIEQAQQAARVAAINTLGGKQQGPWDEAIARAEGVRSQNARRYNEIGDIRIDPKGLSESLKDTVGDSGFAQFIGRPSIDDALKHMAGVAQESRRYYPTAPGDKFSVANLQDIKKSLDSQIKAANNAEQAGRVPPIPAAELENTRSAFIKWFSSRSEDWKQARLQYREDSSPINRMELGRFLENKLVAPLGQERGSSFAGAVRDAPKTITSAVTGRPRFRSLDQVLTPQENEAVINVLREELRSGNVERMAADGMQRAGKIAGEMVQQLPPTGMFQPVLSAARSWVNRAAGVMDEKALAVLAEKLKTPEGAMQLISRLPSETQIEFFKQVNAAAKNATIRGAGVTMEE